MSSVCSNASKKTCTPLAWSKIPGGNIPTLWPVVTAGQRHDSGCDTHAPAACPKSSGGSRISERGGGKDEAPKAPRGWGVGRGCSVPTGEGAVPPPQKIFWFFIWKIVSFSALWGVFYHSSAALFRAKKQSFWLPTCKWKHCLQGESKRQDACWQQHLYEMKWFDVKSTGGCSVAQVLQTLQIYT